MKTLSFWSDPVWRGLRIVSFVTATATLVILAIYLLGATSWRVPLIAAVVANIGVVVAVVIRTIILNAKMRHSTKA